MKKSKKQDSQLLKKAIPLVPRDSLLTEAAQVPQTRDAKTNVAVPSDENVEYARDFVNENQK